jgi:hypothetical protein
LDDEKDEEGWRSVGTERGGAVTSFVEATGGKPYAQTHEYNGSDVEVSVPTGSWKAYAQCSLAKYTTSEERDSLQGNDTRPPQQRTLADCVAMHASIDLRLDSRQK